MGSTTTRLEVRPWTMRLHRWVALTIGIWFALLGVTGTMLVWHGELDRALNPAWFAPRPTCVGGNGVAMTQPVARALDVYARSVDDASATQVVAPATPGAAYVVWNKGAGGERIQHFVDVRCGEYLGRREWGAIWLDRGHLVPALYELHRSALSGEVGHVLIGFVGLFLLGVVVTGAITAWPRSSSREAWKRALSVKRSASTRRWYYDLHRATGMWLSLFLLLMSVSGTYLCFPKEVRALIATVLPTLPAKPVASAALPAVSNASGRSPVVPLPPDALVERAERLWPHATWSRLQLPLKPNESYEVRLLQRGEPRMDTGDTRVRLDVEGTVIETRDPLNAPGGEVLLAWLFPLHSGEALGMPGRLAWSLFGLVPLLLFATGAWLWWQRRAARRKQATARVP